MLKIKSLLTVLAAVTMLAVSALLPMAPVVQADNWGQDSAQSATSTSPSDPCHPERDNPPGQKLTPTQLQSCEACSNTTAANSSACLKSNPITKDINLIVNALAGLVGLVSVIMIIIGGVRYSMARNNPQAISAARGHVINAVFAMVAFMLIWALLQYLVPGGVFNS